MTDKLVKIKPNGMGITESGENKKTKFFKYLDYDFDDYSDISYTPAEARRIANHINKLQTGSTAMVPLYCGGNMCPFFDHCPLAKMNKLPLNRKCLLEVQMLKHWIYQYMQEYNVDPENFTEVGYCNELSEIEIYLWRINNNLAKPENADLMVEQSVGVDKQGDPIYQQQLSPLMELKEKLQNRRSRIVKLMVGDRQERYKREAALKQKDESDPSSHQAEMRRKIEALKRRFDNQLDTNQETKSLPAGKKEPIILTPDELINAEE